MADDSLPEYEIEAKREVAAAGDLVRLKEIFCALSQDKVRERNYLTTIHYYDTDDFSLDASGVVLRTMDAHAPHFPSEICVKTKGAMDEKGTLKREEYSIETQKDGLDLSSINIDRARELIKPATGKSLSEVFNTVSRRDDVCLRFDLNGKKIALDLATEELSIVDMKDGGILRHAFEAELEFKQSKSDPDVTEAEAEAVMDQVIAQLSAQVSMIPLSEGRGEAGFRLMREKRAKSAAKKP